MDTIELLAKFADPEVMKTLALGDRLMAGLITTFLGLGITFVSLIILQIVMGLTARFAAPASAAEEPASSEDVEVVPQVKAANEVDDAEVVAAITTALALQLKTSVSNIVIRNIERVEEPSSAWQRAGIAEQMNNSL